MDERSDDEVYRSHAHELVRFATGLVAVDDAADVVADAFVRLVSSPVWADAMDRRALWFRAVVFEARSWHRATSRRAGGVTRAWRSPYGSSVVLPRPPGPPSKNGGRFRRAESPSGATTESVPNR